MRFFPEAHSKFLLTVRPGVKFREASWRARVSECQSLAFMDDLATAPTSPSSPVDTGEWGMAGTSRIYCIVLEKKIYSQLVLAQPLRACKLRAE